MKCSPDSRKWISAFSFPPSKCEKKKICDLKAKPITGQTLTSKCQKKTWKTFKLFLAIRERDWTDIRRKLIASIRRFFDSSFEVLEMEIQRTSRSSITSVLSQWSTFLCGGGYFVHALLAHLRHPRIRIYYDCSVFWTRGISPLPLLKGTGVPCSQGCWLETKKI